jgi:hypothetical protein
MSTDHQFRSQGSEPMTPAFDSQQYPRGTTAEFFRFAQDEARRVLQFTTLFLNVQKGAVLPERQNRQDKGSDRQE